MLILVPYFLPNVVAGHMWALMLDPRLGVINDVLVSIGLLDSYKAWFADPATAMAAAIIVETWHSFPFFTLLIMAGLKGIPADLYKAADIDGAGAFAQLRAHHPADAEDHHRGGGDPARHRPRQLARPAADPHRRRPRPLDAGAVALCVPDGLQGLQLRLCRRAVGGDVPPADGALPTSTSGSPK